MITLLVNVTERRSLSEDVTLFYQENGEGVEAENTPLSHTSLEKIQETTSFAIIDSLGHQFNVWKIPYIVNG